MIIIVVEIICFLLGRLNLVGKVSFSNNLLIACMCRISREIGFTNENLRGFIAQKNIHVFAPLHSLVLSDEYLDDYHFEIPSMFSSIFHDTTSGSIFFLI